MQQKGLVPVTRRHRVNTTNSNHQLGVFPNLLKSGISLKGINQVWVSDMTYIRTDEGWLYLCTMLDLFFRRVAGYAVSNRIDCHLAITAFQNAQKNRRPGNGVIFHSDRVASMPPAIFASLSAIQAGSRA